MFSNKSPGAAKNDCDFYEVSNVALMNFAKVSAKKFIAKEIKYFKLRHETVLDSKIVMQTKHNI